MTLNTTLKPVAQQAKAMPGWEGFEFGIWQKEINVRDFIQLNYWPYEDDESFLAPATQRTKRIWNRLSELFVEERKKVFWTSRQRRLERLLNMLITSRSHCRVVRARFR